MKINDLCASVTSRIITELEAGAAPWLKPWKSGRTAGIMPLNGATKRPYSGINVLLLWAERVEKGYDTAEWMTFKQAIEKGASVRKGEKATAIVFTKKLTVQDREKEDAEKQVAMLRTYAVFNISQIEGLPPRSREPELATMLPMERAEAFIRAAGADIRLGSDMAAYVPSQDFIAMPAPGQFRDQQATTRRRSTSTLTGAGTRSGSIGTSTAASGPGSMLPRNWWPSSAPRSFVPVSISVGNSGTPDTSPLGLNF